LRDRGEDVVSIARLFLQKFAAEEGKGFVRIAPETEQLLRGYPWPGNVRELENALRNAVVLNDGDALEPRMLPVSVTQRRIVVASEQPVGGTPGAIVPVSPPVQEQPSAGIPGGVVPLWQVEKQAIESAIDHFGGNVLRAAAALEISPSTIYRKRQAWESQAQVG
jgi:DNA-binding NtrC family response regulator